MKIAVHYYKTFRHFDKVDEVVFDYKGTEYLTEFIPNLLKPNQRATINVTNLDIEEIFEYLLILKQKHENFVIQLNWFNQREWIPSLKENNIQFMFYNYATTIDQAYAFSQYEVSDIYICEGLGFNLKQLQKIREKGIALRVYPDIAQSNDNYPVPDINKFFIRPEGLDQYEKYIDIIELYVPDSRVSVVYEIYKQRHWNGYLEDLITGFSEGFSIHNNTILPLFDQLRIDCNRGCLLKDNCHYCHRSLDIGPLMEENDLYITRERNPLIEKDAEDESSTFENNLLFE